MSKIDRAVPKHPQIYRVHDVDSLGKMSPTSTYRVRKRVKVNGKWSTKVTTFSSFEDAKHFARQKFDINVMGAIQMRFSEVLSKFLHHKEFEELRAPGTIHGYRSRAKHFKFFDDLSMRDITPQVIDGWANLMLDPQYKALQQSSRADYDHELTLLSAILRYHREYWDETYVVPIMRRHRKRLCPHRKCKDEIRYLSGEQELLFLEALKPWPVVHDIALFQLHTGARIGEAAAMDFGAVEFVKHQVHIRQHLHWDRVKKGQISILKGTKAGPDRTVPLTSECLDMLRHRYQTRSGSVVFADPKRVTGWMHYRSIQAIYDRAFERLGFSHRGTHTLRHTFAVRFLEQTKDVYALQRALGHTDLEMTMRYAKYSNDSVRKAFQIFRGGRENAKGDVPNLLHGTSTQ